MWPGEPNWVCPIWLVQGSEVKQCDQCTHCMLLVSEAFDYVAW